MAASYGQRNNHKGLLEIDCHLIITCPEDNWGKPGVRVTAGAPALKRNERSINLKLNLPLALFETPSIVATINVADTGAQVSIDAEAVSEAVRQAIGMDIDLQVVDQHGQVIA